MWMPRSMPKAAGRESAEACWSYQCLGPGYAAFARAGHHQRQERAAARRRLARRACRSPDYRRGRRRPTPSCARSMPATRMADGAVVKDAIKVITVRTTGFGRGSRGAAAQRRHRDGRRRPADSGPVEASSAKELSKSDRPELTAAKIVVSGGRGMQPRREVQADRGRWPTSWAPPSAPAAPPSMPASCPTTTRSARPARLWRRSSISPSASRARSSILPA